MFAMLTIYLVPLFLTLAQPHDAKPEGIFLIGNSLTWDTVPGRLAGRARWHVDCGVSLPWIHSHPEKPCVKDSSLWPLAMREGNFAFVSVQPHYGSTLTEDADAISAWMRLQPGAVFVIHSGWAFHAQRESEFLNCDPPLKMTHSPVYTRALMAELSRRHPGREIRQTLAQNILDQVASDIVKGTAPFKDISELYRDSIHMTHGAGKYLMHNTMRRALGQPRSGDGFTELRPAERLYLDKVLALADTSKADREVLARILSPEPNLDRASLIASLADPELRKKMEGILPDILSAVKARPAGLALEAEIREMGGRMVFAPAGPQWLYLATGDSGAGIFDVPASIDLYNGNNPLKGKGGRNERVTDDWLKRLSDVKTLRKLDLANCAIKGEGLRHIAGLSALRELNLTLTPVNDEALRHLAGLSELRVLGLASTQCTGTGFSHLGGLSKLESVNFHFTPLNDAGLKAISGVPIAGRFWFAHTRFTDAGAVALASMKGVKRCGIGSADKASSGAAVAHLAGLPIEDLALLDNQASPEGLGHAAKIGTLRRLDISHAPLVGDDSMAAVAALPHLEEFVLGSARITDLGLMKLAESKSLKKVVLTGIKGVTPDGVARLTKSKPGIVVEKR